MNRDKNNSLEGKIDRLDEKLAALAHSLEKTQIGDYVELLNKPRKLIFRNLLAGIARGIGIAIGFTIFASTIVYLLQLLGALDIPIVGDYIAEIVGHVQRQLEGRAF